MELEDFANQIAFDSVPLTECEEICEPPSSRRRLELNEPSLLEEGNSEKEIVSDTVPLIETSEPSTSRERLNLNDAYPLSFYYLFYFLSKVYLNLT